MNNWLHIDRTYVANDHLVVAYSYTNHGDSNALLFCLVADVHGVSRDRRIDLRMEGNRLPTPELAYVSWGGDDRVICLQGDAPHDGVAINPAEPIAWIVKPGARFRSSLRLRLPLLEWHARLPPTKHRTHRQPVRELTFMLDHLIETRTERLSAKTRLDLPVPLLRRSDEVTRIPGAA